MVVEGGLRVLLVICRELLEDSEEELCNSATRCEGAGIHPYHCVYGVTVIRLVFELPNLVEKWRNNDCIAYHTHPDSKRQTRDEMILIKMNKYRGRCVHNT